MPDFSVLGCISMAEDKKKRINSFRGYLIPAQFELSMSGVWAKVAQKKIMKSVVHTRCCQSTA